MLRVGACTDALNGLETSTDTKPAIPSSIIDCDVHVRWKDPGEIAPYFDEPWRSQVLAGRRTYGWNGYYSPVGTWRRDAVPPSGGGPGSDPQFTTADLLDRYDIEFAVLLGESSHLAMSNLTDIDWAAAIARAYNDWLIDRWLAADPRFLGSVFVAAQDPLQAAAEIDRVGGHPQMVQVQLGSGARAPYGQRQYHPIFAAAERHGLAIAIHVGSDGAGTASPPTSAGYPGHYIEWHTCLPGTLQAHVVSMLCEGVFELFPRLRLVVVEGGVSWLPGTLWRLDKAWRALRSEVPWVTRPPSEYAAEHVRVTTQPLEEPSDPSHLAQVIAMYPSMDMLVFSSDYPHWDFDNPRRALSNLPHDLQQRIFRDNARALYRLPEPVAL